jgi:hypothetical protein
VEDRFGSQAAVPISFRDRLSETQLAELFEPPTEQRELVRHYR